MGRFLYRGVNKQIHETNDGELIPKGNKFTYTFKFGDFKFNEGVVFGETIKNAVHGHQKNSKIYKTSGISTTPMYERALYYATNRNKHEVSYVYKIDTALLSFYKIYEYIVNDIEEFPKNREDNEVILVAQDNGVLPRKIIAQVIIIEGTSIKVDKFAKI